MKNKTTAILLTLFTGWLGIHKFYLGRTVAGILYLLFFWTFVPGALSFIDLIILIVMSENDFNDKFNGSISKAETQKESAKPKIKEPVKTKEADKSDLSAEGINGQIFITGNKVTIRRKGGMALLTQGLKGEKNIPVKNITSVQFKQATKITNGFIQFSILAGNEAKGGILNAVNDENTVMFNAKQEPDFIEVKNYIEDKIFS